MPNQSADQAVVFLSEFQERLKGVSFFEIDKRITLSIGVVEAGQDCPLTGHEILSMLRLPRILPRKMAGTESQGSRELGTPQMNRRCCLFLDRAYNYDGQMNIHKVDESVLQRPMA